MLICDMWKEGRRGIQVNLDGGISLAASSNQELEYFGNGNRTNAEGTG